MPMPERPSGEEITAVHEIAAERKEAAGYETAAFSIASAKHPDRNEDAYAVGEGSAAVCDGIGGYPGGELASRTAAERLAFLFQKFRTENPKAGPAEARAMMLAAFDDANQAVIRAAKAGDRPGAGTTATAVYIVETAEGGRKALVAWLGNTRAYRVSGRDAH